MELLHGGSVETPLLVWNDIKRSELRKVQILSKAHDMHFLYLHFLIFFGSVN